MWVSVLNKRAVFESEWVQFKLSFEPRWFRHDAGFGSERGRFGSGSGPTRVSTRDGFRIATGFGLTRVSARDDFRAGTSFVLFRPVLFRRKPFRRVPFSRVLFQREPFSMRTFRPIPLIHASTYKRYYN
ncbi:hypothetical protein HanPI659440_Chr12g0473971 [Helianthus annuus]|nr:hypothetical protein HanPI659440_Chr12g0473971 [Helianthus annuus]